MALTLALGIDGKGATKGAQTYVNAAGRVVDANGRYIKTNDQVKKSTAAVGSGFITLAKKVAALAAAYVSLKSAKTAITVAANFEEQMAELQTVIRGTAEEMQSLSEVAREMGATTKFTAAEAASGLTFLARAGFSANEAMAALPGTLQLAVAANLDLARAADIASNVLSQFNLEAEETGRVGDVLVTTANNANTNVEQLAEGMKFAGPLAAALGVSMEEASAAIGVMGDAGIQGSLAGTNLRGVLARLLNPSTEATEALEKMGLTLQDVNPESNSLVAIFTKLNEKGLTAGEALKIFGRLNVSAAVAISKSVDSMDQLTKKNREAAGAAEEAAKIMGQTFAGRMRALKSAAEELAIQLVSDNGLLGGLKDVVSTMAEMLKVLGGNEEAVQNMSREMAIFNGVIELGKAAISGIFDAFETVFWAIGDGISKLAEFIGINLVDGGFGDLLESIGRMENATLVMKEAFVANFKTIAAAIEIFLWKPIVGVFNGIKEGAAGVGKFFKAAFEAPLAAVQIAISDFAATSIEILAAMLQDLASAVGLVSSDIAASITAVQDNLGSVAHEIRKAGQEGAGALGEEMTSAARQVEKGIEDAAKAFVSPVTTFWEKVDELQAAREKAIKDGANNIEKIEKRLANAEKARLEEIKKNQLKDLKDEEDAKKEALDREVAATKEAEDRKLAAIEEGKAARIEAFKDELKKKIELEMAIIEAEKERQLETEKMRKEALAGISGNLAGLTDEIGESNRTAFNLHKAFASAQAGINAYLAFSNIMASPLSVSNPGLAQALATTTLALGLQNAAKIASQDYKGGRALGGAVPSNSFVRVAENGPEIIEQNNRQFLVTGGSSAQVSPAMAPNVNVNLIGAQGDEQIITKQSSDGGIDIDIIMGAVRSEVVQDVANDGPIAQAIGNVYNLNRSVSLNG